MDWEQTINLWKCFVNFVNRKHLEGFTCLKFGMSSNSSSLVKNSQTSVSNAASKSCPNSTGNTFCVQRNISTQI